jgi:hypothetical protein
VPVARSYQLEVDVDIWVGVERAVDMLVRYRQNAPRRYNRNLVLGGLGCVSRDEHAGPGVWSRQVESESSWELEHRCASLALLA